MPQPGTWLSKPRKSLWTLRHGATSLLVAPGVQIVQRLLEWGWGKNSPYVAFFALALILGLVLVDRFTLRMKAEDRALVDDAFGEQLPVEVAIVVQGKRLGTDRGVVWFSEGLMGFSGAASSFVLRAGDLQPQSIKAKRAPGRNNSRPSDALVLWNAPKEAYVVVSPLLGHRKAYRACFKRFFEADVWTQEERFWPPLEPYNGAILSSTS